MWRCGFNVQQDGNDVIVEGSGSLDLTGLTFTGFPGLFETGRMAPVVSRIWVGSSQGVDNLASATLIYSWSFSSLPAGSSAVLCGAGTATPSFVADVEDTYVVQLVVTDEGALSSVADEVTISSDNMAPTAVATVDFSLAIVGDSVQLDGSGSTDPEMDSLSYSWSITAAPVASTATLVGDDTAFPTLITDVDGTYDVTLTSTLR